MSRFPVASSYFCKSLGLHGFEFQLYIKSESLLILLKSSCKGSVQRYCNYLILYNKLQKFCTKPSTAYWNKLVCKILGMFLYIPWNSMEDGMIVSNIWDRSVKSCKLQMLYNDWYINSIQQNTNQFKLGNQKGKSSINMYIVKDC